MLFSTLGAAFGASGSPSSSKSASPGLRKINKLNPDSLLWAPWFATVCPPRSHHEGKSSHRGGAGGDSQQGVFDNLQLRAITAELIKQTISLLRKNNVAQQLSGQTIVAFDGDQPANVGVQHHEFAWRSQGDCDKGISVFFWFATFRYQQIRQPKSPWAKAFRSSHPKHDASHPRSKCPWASCVLLPSPPKIHPKMPKIDTQPPKSNWRAPNIDALDSKT